MVSDDQLMDIGILSCKITVIQIQSTHIAATVLKRFCNLSQIIAGFGHTGGQMVDLRLIEGKLIFSILLGII